MDIPTYTNYRGEEIDSYHPHWSIHLLWNKGWPPKKIERILCIPNIIIVTDALFGSGKHMDIPTYTNYRGEKIDQYHPHWCIHVLWNKGWSPKRIARILCIPNIIIVTDALFGSGRREV